MDKARKTYLRSLWTLAPHALARTCGLAVPLPMYHVVLHALPAWAASETNNHIVPDLLCLSKRASFLLEQAYSG